MISRIDIRGINGNPMRAILVQAKEKRPNHLEVIAQVDLIEFYDLHYMHTPDGQFICEYDVDTYMENAYSNRGLDLYTSEQDWKITGRTRHIIADWINYLSYKSPKQEAV